MTEKILFLSDTCGDGTLSARSAEALGAAIAVASGLPGAELSAGLFGEEVQPAADSIVHCGATAIRGVAGPEFGVSRYSTDAAAAEALVRSASATLVIAPASARLARALPGVALRAGGRIDSRIVGLEAGGDGIRMQRWFYRQRLMATLTRSERPWFLLLDEGAAEPWSGTPGEARVEAVEVALAGGLLRTRVEGEVAAAADARTIRPEADLLLVAGAGWTKKQADGATHVPEAEELILEFLEKARASLGGSKSLVEQGGEGGAVLSFMTHLNQVGQTGSSPRHAKGLATCCHGEEPHVVGWRFIGERRAVNLDPGCGWARGKADVLYVADAFEVMREVNRLLGESAGRS